MAWRIEFHPDAAKELRALDRTVAARIVKTLETRIAGQADPRALGSALKGEHSGYWRWRIGDYRIVGRVEDDRITILIVRDGHRREVYGRWTRRRPEGRVSTESRRRSPTSSTSAARKGEADPSLALERPRCDQGGQVAQGRVVGDVSCPQAR